MLGLWPLDMLGSSCLSGLRCLRGGGLSRLRYDRGGIATFGYQRYVVITMESNDLSVSYCCREGLRIAIVLGLVNPQVYYRYVYILLTVRVELSAPQWATVR